MNPNPANKIFALIQEQVGTLWTSAIGEVINIDPGYRCSVKVRCTVEGKEFPIIRSVPIASFAVGNTSIRLPISAGDLVILLFLKYPPSVSVAIPDYTDDDERLFSSVVAIPGLFRIDKEVDVEDKLVIESDKDVQIETTGNVTIKGAQINLNPP
jgi:hypothetical protein